MLSAEEVKQVLAEADLIYEDSQVQSALDEMALRITERLADKNPLLLAVMVGGLIPAAELSARLDFPLQLDYVHATRYRGDTRGSELHWLARPGQSLKGRVILVVDDILDEGITLNNIVDFCRGAGAAEVYTAVLVEKQRPRETYIRPADFLGLKIPDRYVFGYGMDYQHCLRHVRGIYAVRGL